MTDVSSTTDVETPPGKDMKDVQDVKDLEDVQETKEPEYPPLARALIVILALYLAVFLVALDQTIIGVAIPKITDQFKSISDIAWYGSAYFLTSTALQPSYGRIYKIFSVSSPTSHTGQSPLNTWFPGKMGLPNRSAHLRNRLPHLRRRPLKHSPHRRPRHRRHRRSRNLLRRPGNHLLHNPSP